MAGGQQLRLLLWKDYLIRKRKPITLAGVVWATLVTLSLYVVRINVENKDYPTCQFAARALPSAGVLNFLQTFVCNVNNDCSPMDQFQEIPTYENSTFTQLQRQLSPLLENATVVDVVSSAPGAIKLLATLADVADNNIFAGILKNGLKMSDLFRNPRRVKRLIAQKLDIPEVVSNSIITADVGFDGIMQGNFDRCSVNLLKKTIKVDNVDHLILFSNKLCKLNDEQSQNLVKELLLQIDLGKYITMAGEMYSKLAGDNRITKMGYMIEAVLKMMSLESFLPSELVGIIQGRKPEFSYFNMTIITKVIDLFQPTFGETDSYKSLKDFADTLVLGLQYLNNILVKQSDNIEEVEIETHSGIKRLSQIFSNIADVVSGLGGDKPLKILDVLSSITNFIMKWLPDSTKSDVLFYSTLLGKLIEGADKVVIINTHIEQMIYNVSLRNPQGVKVLLGLKHDLFEKGLEALVDTERAQILTSKINDVGQMFCDTNRLKNFFLISREEAMDLKSQLCTDAWKNYILDLITSFGIYDVKNNINSMASLFILSTIGQDISGKLYSIDKDFEILKKFIEHVKNLDLEKKTVIDWSTIFKTSDSELLKIFRKKAQMGRHILITIHGTLAKEIITQNPLLEYKIAPILKDSIIMINAMNDQLVVSPKYIQIKVKEVYPEIVLTILNTARDEEKSYRALSTSCQDMLCYGLEKASKYLNFPENIDQNDLVTILCNLTVAVEKGLKRESVIGKAIAYIKNTTHSPLEEINWTELISGLNNLYEKLDADYTYLFEYKTFGMNEEIQKKVTTMAEEVQEFWFSVRNLNRAMHISIKFGLRVLDLLDRDVFNIQSEPWINLKYSLASATGPLVVVDDFTQLIAGVAINNSYISSIPSKTAINLKNILQNLPALFVDIVNLTNMDNTDINPIISIMNSERPWPCSYTSLADLLQLSNVSQTAIKSLETLLCFDEDMRMEWKKYLDDRNVTLFKKTWNTTTYPENVFLKFSAAFDSVLKDFGIFYEILQIAFDEDEENEQLTLMSALRYMESIFNGTDSEIILRSFFFKVDTVLNSINTTHFDSVPLHRLWQEYRNCTKECQLIRRATWKYTLEFLSVVGGNVTKDLFILLQESNEPNVTILQLLGFTRDTGLYMLYDKLPDFIAVLVNSYFDLGFLKQIRRASVTQFWDCDEVVTSLKPGLDSSIDMDTIKSVQQFICPSLLYWVSMPTGANKLIDLISKPQYQFFTLEVRNLSSTYEQAYTNAKNLSDIIKDISKKNFTKIFNFNLEVLKNKLENAIDNLISYRIKKTDTFYQSFNEANKKYFTASVYLTRIVTIINKLLTKIDIIKIADIINDTENMKSLESELAMLQKTFKRRPPEAIAFHFDLVTNVLVNNSKGYKLTDALEDICGRSKAKDNSKDILEEIDRVKIQICAKKYDLFYSVLQHVLDDEELNDARKSLENVIESFKDNNENVSDIYTFFKERPKLVNTLRTSIKYSYDLGIPIYLKYLQNNLKQYDIILTFLSGENWWEELKKIYDGPKAKTFFNNVEKVFDIAEDVLTHLDKIHLIRLIRDINMNNTDALCQANLTISDYVPDSTGILSTMHRQICDTDTTELFKELPSFLVASQSHDHNLKISDEIDYRSLYLDISNTESNLKLIENGPQEPLRPSWVTEENLKMLKHVVMELLSRESLIKMSFGVVSNVVDAGTLFINNSQCTLCSQFTTWFKQLNLQLYKKQEYDNLLCSLDSAPNIYTTLKNDFHWDMAISELISTRNYTKYELNKSMNELLEQIKLHLLDDINAKTTKLFDCLASNLTGNAFGHAALFAKIVARTAKLLRSYLPYLQEVPGITSLPYLKQLQAKIAHNLNVKDDLSKYLTNVDQMTKHLAKFVKDKKLVDRIKSAKVDVSVIKDLKTTNGIFIQDYSWEVICENYDCKEIITIVKQHVNITLVELSLPKLQAKEFWNFNFLSSILLHVEVSLDHFGRMLGVISKVDLEGVKEGKLKAIMDTGLQILMDDTMESILYSVLGLLRELEPVVRNTSLEFDIKAVTDGLMIIRQFKNYLVDEDFKVNISQVFSHPKRIKSSLNNLGINNTNFWSIAASRIRMGYIAIKPLLTQKQSSYHISDFVCQTDNMSKVLIPEIVDVVTLEHIYGSVAEQFCGMEDEKAKGILPVLMENVNYNMVIDKLKTFLLSKLFLASNLTQLEGDAVLSQLNNLTTLIPELQGNLDSISEKLSNEPLLKRLKKSTAVGDILASSDFLKDAGNMLCGKPFYTDISRFYKAIAQTKDMSSEPDRAQLDALPTDFCRSMYKEIITMNGGKIVWSFIKPLIVGKILYTPDNPAVQKIIEQANSTFVPMAKVVNIVHSFASSFSSIDKLTQHKNGLNALKNLMTSPQFGEMRKSLIGDFEATNINIDGVFDSFVDTEEIGGLLRKASNLLHCFNIDRFKVISNEHDLTLEAARLAMINEFSAGLVFLNMSETEKEVPSKIEYKIRMDIDNAPTTTNLRNYLWIPGPESNFLENMRYFRGFVQLQDIIDKAIIELSISSSRKIHKRETEENKLDWAVYTQQEPYPCYKRDFFQTSLYESQSLMVVFFFSLLFTVCSAVRFIVSDKETGNTMLMSVMGVNLSYHTLSWFVWSLVEVVVTVACITVMLCWGQVLPRSDPSLIFVLLLIFGFSVLAFCYLLSTMFRSASLAAVCTGIAYLITYMPFILILSLEEVLNNQLKIFVSLSMSSSLCYGLLFIGRFEAMGTGAGWSKIWETPDNTSDMNIAIAAVMVFVDGVLYIVIGYLINRFCGVKSENNVTNCQETGEKAGVSIINVTKIYDEGSRRAKLALDNLSMELQKGQITTLLGHNGAGKTTLIKILTGMLKPTTGHVIVRSDDENGTGLGVCPQRDVLFEYMTAKEHIALYAQLKSGQTLDKVQDEVDGMLGVLSLGSICDIPVARLSGGTRRRLCVALAFVARPRLVVLDEPTAGVDPAARRDIWSMIMKLRENRTILLTTHHLDEAELLSDQIVIMHKGQIHTTGTPIEIKRSLGTGYKLTVMYPDRRLHLLEDTDNEESSIEEKMKNLLAVTRSVVKNANVVDVNGLEVEINLPFFDSDGVNNNFMKLCSALELQRDTLAYRSLSLDCSSLEQVFYNVCQQLDGEISSIPESASKSASTSSIKTDNVPLVSPEGVLKGSTWEQFVALLYARYLHYLRNRWLLFLLIILPSLFITVAMGFSTIRPPVDAEVSLHLYPDMYEDATQYLTLKPSIYSSNINPSFAQGVLDVLRYEKEYKNWTSEDSPTCKCLDSIQQCDADKEHEWNRTQMMVLPDVATLNDWLTDSHANYIEKRYGGYTSVIQNNITHLVAWYNNKGHHALPAFLNALNNAILRVVSGNNDSGIKVYTHPLKISKETLNKDTLYQHVADAGVSGLLLIAYALTSAGGAVYLVTSRRSQEKRLQLLCGVTPLLYCTTALLWDMAIIMINLAITTVVLEIFHFPVFVARNNLPAICILIVLYGYACSNLVHVMEKIFTEASMANMLLFCGNAFIGLAGITLLLILDIISESDATDHARWVVHKILLLSPQFVLGDGLLEIAKNTIQAEVLSQFGMETYRDPLKENVVGYHYVALILVGTVLFVLNLAIEYDYFDVILNRFRSRSKVTEEIEEPEEVSAEVARVHASLQPLRLRTIGNINAGFVDSEKIIKNGSIKRTPSLIEDICACVSLRKVYGSRCALHGLTLGIPPGQCTALLGENGAGKSTTFSMLTGELRPTAGQIYLHETKVTARDLCQGLISYCPQSDAIDPLLTVRETLVLYCRLRGIDDRDEVIRRTMESFELTKYESVRTGALSGGNKRKLCAAVAFMGRAPLVLLDEPTSGMDPLSRACVSRCVRGAVHARRGALLATHALDDARRLAARVALLKQGRLVALASLDDCLRRFGGGYIVACRVRRGAARSVWTRIHARAPHASLRVLHHAAVHFLLPTHATVEGKEVITNLSDIFRLLSELQTSCDIEDYTVNQSSLDQMFLNFTERTSILDPIDDQIPTPCLTRRFSEELDSVTSL